MLKYKVQLNEYAIIRMHLGLKHYLGHISWPGSWTVEYAHRHEHLQQVDMLPDSIQLSQMHSSFSTERLKT